MMISVGFCVSSGGADTSRRTLAPATVRDDRWHRVKSGTDVPRTTFGMASVRPAALLFFFLSPCSSKGSVHRFGTRSRHHRFFSVLTRPHEPIFDRWVQLQLGPPVVKFAVTSMDERIVEVDVGFEETFEAASLCVGITEHVGEHATVGCGRFQRVP